jgi:outer membrane protein assembly factor BamE (lipoprotein component of BamABCDE complex)
MDKKMKNIKVLFVSFMACILMWGCSTIVGITNDKLMKVEKGMSKQQITSLLGKPQLRRFDNDCEEWKYESSPVVGSSKVIIIRFVDERVTNMDSFDAPQEPQTPALPSSQS